MSRLASQIDRHAARGIEHVRRKIRGRRQLCSVLTLPLEDALADIRIGAAVAELVAASFACVGAGPAQRECAVCQGPWSLDRTPALLTEVEYVRVDEALFGLVCEECAKGPDPAGAILAAVARDLGLDPRRVVVMPEPGHA